MKVSEIKEIIKGLPDNADIPHIINENDYFAVKLWSAEDIEDTIRAIGYEPTPDDVEKVLESDDLKHLEDCTDEDWATLKNTVKKVLDLDELQEEL